MSSEAVKIDDSFDIRTVNRLLTPEEVAHLFHVPLKNIYSQVYHGHLKKNKVPGSSLLRFDPEYIRSLLFATSNEISSLKIRRKRRP